MTKKIDYLEFINTIDYKYAGIEYINECFGLVKKYESRAISLLESEKIKKDLYLIELYCPNLCVVLATDYDEEERTAISIDSHMKYEAENILYIFKKEQV